MEHSPLYSLSCPYVLIRHIEHKTIIGCEPPKIIYPIKKLVTAVIESEVIFSALITPFGSKCSQPIFLKYF